MSINEKQLKSLIDGLSIQAAMAPDDYIRVPTDVIENLVSTLVEYQCLNRQMEREITRLVSERHDGS